MADDSHGDYLAVVCDEIILRIFSLLGSRSLLRLSETCKRFHRICLFEKLLWSRLCMVDFTINLTSPSPLGSFRHLYKLLHESREILKFYLSNRFPVSENHRYGVLPGWLWPWIVLNTNPPWLPAWIRTYHEPFLRFKMSEISLGKILRVWNLKSSDLPGHLVTRVEYGTLFYRWRDIQIVAMRVHGGQKGLENFLLKRCARARGYVERTFERIRCGNFSPRTRVKLTQSGEGSSAVGEPSTVVGEPSTAVGEPSTASSGNSATSHRQQDVEEESVDMESD